MSMKKQIRRGLLAAMAAPGLALAADAAPPAQSLAAVEAVLEHCAKLVPTAADRYREQAKLLTQGASEETLAKVRASEEYRTAHDATAEALAKVSDRDAKSACEPGQ